MTPLPVAPAGPSEVRGAWGDLALVMVIFALWGAIVIPSWRWQINPDGVSYISIAQKYLAAHFTDGINAYWSPLYAWLLAALIALGIEPLLATKVLALLIGESILATSWWLGANLRLTRDVQLLVGLTLCPILIHFGMLRINPDLLVTAAVLLCLAQMTSPGYEQRRRSRVVSGALGGVAYLSKAYALPFCLAYFTLVNLFDLVRNRHERRRILVTAAAGYVAFAAVAGLWVACLTYKYGNFTIGSASRFSLAWNGPKFRIPMADQGLLPPPDALAVSSWDDVTMLRYPEWNPFGSASERAHFARLRARNLAAIAGQLSSFTWLFWPIVIAAVVCAGTRADPAPRRPALLLLAAVFLYPAGYALLHSYERFLSSVCVLVLLLGAWVIVSAARAFQLPRMVRVLAALALCASFLTVWQPEGRRPARAFPQPQETVAARVRRLGRWNAWDGRDTGRRFAAIAAALREEIPAGSRVAAGDHWGWSLYVSHHLGVKSWGVIAPRASPKEALADLRAHGIEYFWFWGNLARFPFVVAWPRIEVAGAAKGLKVYRVPRDHGRTGIPKGRS